MTTDIYSFINSRDIRKYLRETEHHFSSLEAAWIIWQSMDRTWGEKKAAWAELIRTMPDCEVPERFNCNYRASLHGYLKDYMAVKDQQISDFLSSNAGDVYSYRIHFHGDGRWALDYSDTGISPTFESCLTAAKKSIAELMPDPDEELQKSCPNQISDAADSSADFSEHAQDIVIPPAAEIEIRKQFLSDTAQEYTASLNQDGDLLDITKAVLSAEEKEILWDSFDGLWFAFPVPFRKGDIVVELKDQRFPGHRFSGGPFVLTHVASWDAEHHSPESGDNSDMIAGGHFQDEDGSVFDEVMDNYMNCEYYRGPFDGVHRLLKALSSFEKDEISLMLLLTAYRHILLDHAANDSLLSWFTEEGLRLAGLDQLAPAREKQTSAQKG